jgi:rubrerythrin
MENTIVNELNGLLKGEHMAIEAYDRYIQAVEDCNVKEELQNIQMEHKSHASTIAKRIQNLGGKPDENTGFAGFMANAKATIQSVGNKSTIDILKQAYDGEYKGIAMAEELVKGDLDNDSANLVQKILSADQGHLKKMKGIIEGIENLH